MTTPRAIRVVGRTGLWLVTAVATIALFEAGLDKFAAAAGWQHWFVDVWSYPTWLRASVGVAETGGALLLLWPRTASYSAGGLILIMLAAYWTVTTKPADLSAIDPLVNVELLAVVMIGWWPRRVRAPLRRIVARRVPADEPLRHDEASAARRGTAAGDTFIGKS